MIYFDNAATTRFKPKNALTALIKETKNSSNSGRSGHDDALKCMSKNEKTRQFLLKMYGAENGYNLVFTKNCTEALNLAIFGLLKGGEKIVTSVNEHNSTLRPLFKLGSNLNILNPSDNYAISAKHALRLAYDADFLALNVASNVTGAICDIEEIGIKKSDKTVFLVDGAQASPLVDINMSKFNIDMLAMPGHKGLHGIQGTGFLIFNDKIKLSPLIYGGTGTASDSVYQPTSAPEGFEAGTSFSAGIHALFEGAKWSFSNKEQNAIKIRKLTNKLLFGIGTLGLKCFTKNPALGIASFKDDQIPPSVMADELNTLGFAVRSGLHCAPLIHNFLGTLETGLVRASLGVETTEREIDLLLNALDKIMVKKKDILKGFRF